MLQDIVHNIVGVFCMVVYRFVVDAVVLQHRSVREVSLETGLSRRWIYELVKRYNEYGYEGLESRSKRPKTCPSQLPLEIEEEIVLLRKTLDDLGVDSGPHTIKYHLEKRYGHMTSTTTIWRILKRRGFITAQPQKKPRSSWKRFEAFLPNECWQTDMTHYTLADNTKTEIATFLDDHSRYILASQATRTATSTFITDIFNKATKTYGYPQSILSDNGAIYTAKYRHGTNIFETLLNSHNIIFKHGQPYHPQTQGKIERWHQTLKKYLDKQTPAETLEELQHQLDTFVDYYNHIRPHRALNRHTPETIYNKTIKAHPPTTPPRNTYRTRRDKTDNTGKFTLRHNNKLYKISLGRKHKNTRIIATIKNLDITITTTKGKPITKLTLNPNTTYQPTTKLKQQKMNDDLKQQ